MINPQDPKSALQFLKKHPYLFWSTCFGGGVIGQAALNGRNILADIPLLIWTGVLTASVTIIGIGLTNEGNDMRLYKQLDHDRSIKLSDRLVSLRKENYGKAVSSIGELEDMMITIARISPDEMMRRRKEFRQNIFLLEIVSTKKTGRLARILRKEWNSINDSLRVDVNKLRASWSNLLISERNSNTAAEDCNSLNILKKKKDPSATPQKIEGANASYKHLRAATDAAKAEYDTLKSDFNQKAKEKVKRATAIKKLLMISIRKDLSIPEED